MILYENNLLEPFRTYGIKHFKEKYCLKDEVLSLIEVKTNQIEDKIISWIKTAYGEIPLFEDIKDKNYIEEKEGKIKINFDAYTAIGKILSGHLEKLSEEEKTKISKIPVVDLYEQILFDAITDAALKEGKTVEPKPFWPENKKFAVLLTHDIDEIKKTYQYFTRSIIHLKRGEIRRALDHIKSFFYDKITGNNPYWTFEKMMELEEELGVRSTSYFLQEDGRINPIKPGTIALYARKYKFNNPQVKAIMKTMAAGGWEIGLHGSYYSYLSEEKLRQEKTDLENALGMPIAGTRQHHLNLKIPDTWEHHEKIGLEYDTSLGFKKYVGFRWGTCFPFKPLNAKTGKEMNIIELPLTIMDATLFDNKEKAWKEISEVIESVEGFGGLLVVLFHHSTFNEREYPGWTETYKKIISTCKEKNAWIATGKEITQWWKTR